MIVNHVLRHDFSDKERQVIAAYLGEQRLATRKEIKGLLYDEGGYGNGHWTAIMEAGLTRLERWQESSE